MPTQTTPPATICPGNIPWCTDHTTTPEDDICRGRLIGTYGELVLTYSAETGIEYGAWNLHLDLTPTQWAALNQAVTDATTALQNALTEAVTR